MREILIGQLTERIRENARMSIDREKERNTKRPTDRENKRNRKTPKSWTDRENEGHTKRPTDRERMSKILKGQLADRMR